MWNWGSNFDVVPKCPSQIWLDVSNNFCYFSTTDPCTIEEMRLADIKQGEHLLGDSGSPPDQEPVWLDKDKFRRGQAFFQKHILSITNAMNVALVIGFSLRNLAEPLAYTKQSDEPRKSLRRYLKTFYYLLVWHTGDVWEVGSYAYNAVQSVRKMHSTVSNSMNKTRSRTFSSDAFPLQGSIQNGKKQSMYFSQFDMALVQSGFMGLPVLYPRGFGIICTLSDLEDYIHFWRGIGYLLGIEDRFNICSGNYAETFLICKDIETLLMVPAGENPAKEFDMLASAYCDGINLMAKVPLYSPKAFFAFGYKISGRKVPRLDWPDMLRYWFLRFIVVVFWMFPQLELYLNNLILERFYSVPPPPDLSSNLDGNA